MKKGILGFIAGIITTILLLTLFVPSLAANTLQTIETAFNTVNISLDGILITKQGENYVRKGTEGEIPQSLTYEGTIFVPIRRIGEIYGLNVDYDANSKTVILMTDSYKLGKDTNAKMYNEDAIDTDTPNVTEVTITKEMYKEWNDKEKLSYEEFKSLWDLSVTFKDKDGTVLYQALYNGQLSKLECQYTFHNRTEPYLGYVYKMIDEISKETDNNKINIDFVYNENGNKQGLQWYSYKH